MDTLARLRWTTIGVLMAVAVASSLAALLLGPQKAVPCLRFLLLYKAG